MAESVVAQLAHDAHDRKVVYVERPSAERAAHAINQRERRKAVRAYGCSHCGFFHVGRRVKA
jgi:hypothetical protein